jgi:Cof subfamily protein (haloacid dehalogenase superfamily)
MPHGSLSMCAIVTDAKRLIATDVDGTLLGPDKRVSVSTRDAFKRLHAAGLIDIALVSSRMPTSLEQVEASLGVPCWKIAYDGALIAAPAGDATRLELAGGIEIEEVAALLDPSHIAYVGAYAGDLWVCNAQSEWSEREAFNTQVSPGIEPDLLGALARGGQPLNKIMFRDSESRIAALRSRLEHLELKSGRWFSNGPTIVELVCHTASKAAGLDALVGRLQVADEQVTVFGDGANDVSMFEHYADSVAVNNAIPELKARARHHTARGDQDGVAQFLLRRMGPRSPK